jgi:hypothetical protein
VKHSWVDLVVIVVRNLFFLSSYGIDMDLIHLLCYLNIDIVCIVLTQISYVYSYCLNMNVVCVFVVFTHKNHAHDFRV